MNYIELFIYINALLLASLFCMEVANRKRMKPKKAKLIVGKVKNGKIKYKKVDKNNFDY